jgi:hypothetical protein
MSRAAAATGAGIRAGQISSYRLGSYFAW